MKHDSQFCSACGREFTRGLVEMVRQVSAVCDQCQRHEERIREAQDGLEGDDGWRDMPR
jgi:hypothetical protein